jgi:hypothetical protein
MTVRYAGVEIERSAWPVVFNPDNWCERTRSGELSPHCGLWKIRGVDPAAAARIFQLQPFFAKDGATKDALWQLDQLCNIDKHREVVLAVVAPSKLRLQFQPPVIFDEQVFENGPFEDNAVIATFRAESVSLDLKVSVDAEMECQVLFEERGLAHAGQLTGPLVPTLEVMVNYVRKWVLPQFEPYLT